MPLSKWAYFSLIGLALVGVGLTARWYVENENDGVRSHPKRFCYETFRGPVNATLYITDVDDSTAYLRYYRAVRQGQNPVIEFPLHGLDPSSPVYVQRWLGADSALAEVVSYYQSGDKSRPYRVRCYVDAHTLHIAPPKQASRE